MSNKTETKTGKAAAGKNIKVKQAAPTFPVNRLRQDCLALFGITASTFDGAVSGLAGEFTVAQMKKQITEWQSQLVLPREQEEVK